MFDEFMAQNPNITIKYETFPWDVFIQTIQTSLPAGNTADVILLPGGYTCRYALGGQLLSVPNDIMMLEQAKETYFRLRWVGKPVMVNYMAFRLNTTLSMAALM